MIESLKTMYQYVLSQITSMGINDVIDILVVAIVLYYLFRFVRQRRASKLAVGIVLLFVLYLISDLVGLSTIRFLMDNIFQVGLIAVMIVFQPELRSMLESFGGQTKRFRDLTVHSSGEHTVMVDQVAHAVSALAKDRTGALIVIQRTTPLGEYINSGSVVNADVNALLLRNLFFNKSPLHDGAVIICDGRIYAAGCLLPLSTDTEIMQELGTRHRAAIGASENSDAVIIVVSEETGVVSVAQDGVLTRGYTGESLRALLEQIFITPNMRRSRRQRSERAVKKVHTDREGQNDKHPE